MKIMDLFSGVGGFSIGAKMSKAKIKVIAANELDKEIAKSYLHNHKNIPMIQGDISKVKKELFKYKADMIIGGPPCQGFSMAGKRNRKSNFIDDPRNYLFREYIDVVKHVDPKYILMENVPGISTMANGEILNEIIDNLVKMGYDVSWKILNAADFSVPQDRKRFILFGTKNKEIKSIDLFNKLDSFRFKPTTIKDAIWDLYSNKKYIGELSILRDSDIITNNNPTNHSEKAIKLMSYIKQGENKDILKNMGFDIKSVHSGAYGRAKWSERSKTIITRFDTPSSGRYIHPELNRTFTPREGARIQTFPDSINFLGTRTSIYKQIGNAVPPLLSKAIFDALQEIIK